MLCVFAWIYASKKAIAASPKHGTFSFEKGGLKLLGEGSRDNTAVCRFDENPISTGHIRIQQCAIFGCSTSYLS